MKIKAKLFFSFLSVTALLIIMGFFLIDAGKKGLNESIGNESMTVTQGVMNALDREVYSRVEDGEVFSTRPLIQQMLLESNAGFEKIPDRDNYISDIDQKWIESGENEMIPEMKDAINNPRSEDLRNKIDFFKNKYNYNLYAEIFITNKYGVIVAQSGRTSDYNQADEEWWQKTRESGSYVSEIEYDESSGSYSIALGTKISGKDGNFIGIMKTVLSIEEIFSYLKEAKETSKYKSANFKLIDQNGKMIYDTEQNYKLFENITEEPFYKRMTSGEGYFFSHEKKENRDELFAYVRSHGHKSYKGLGWILLQELDAGEIHGSIDNLQRILIIVSAAGILIAILLDFFLYNSIFRPITKLRDTAFKIGQGDLDAPIEADNNDEIGELAGSIKHMANDLKKSRTAIEEYNINLKKEVENRTKELQDKVAQLEKFNKLAVSRELAMVELKKKIKKLEEGKR